MASYCNYQTEEENLLGRTFDSLANPNFGFVLNMSGREQKLHPSFLWFVCQIYYCIMALCHTFS